VWLCGPQVLVESDHVDALVDPVEISHEIGAAAGLKG
jgi:hypothetical protein